MTPTDNKVGECMYLHNQQALFQLPYSIFRDINITAARENINSADQIVLPKPFTHHSRQPIKVTSNAAYGVTNAVHIAEHEDLHCGNEYDYI